MTMQTLTDVNDAVTAALQVGNLSLLPQFADDLAAIGTPAALGARERLLGVMADSKGERVQALEHLERALEIFISIGDERGEVNALSNIGMIYLSTGASEQALVTLHRALAIVQELGDRQSVAVLLSNIGHAQAVIGQNAAALESFFRALAIHQDLDQPYSIGSCSCNIGNMYKYAGDYPTALEYYHRALEIFENGGNQRFLGNVLLNMGGTYDLLGNTDTAISYHQRALAVFEALEFPPGVAISLSTVGLMHSRLGQPETALEVMRRSRSMLTHMGDILALGNLLANMISVLVGLDRWTEAEDLLRELDSLHLTDPNTVALRYIARSSLLEHAGDLEGAVQVLHDALEYLDVDAAPDQQAQIHSRLRAFALQRNDLPAYVEHNNAFTRITEEINGRSTAAKLAMQEAQRVMDRERKVHEKQLAVLHATLPKSIADRVARGETVSDHIEHAAVLFLDIAGFTTHSSELSSHQVTALLEEVFRTFDAICKEHGVTKVKTIGDAYLCFDGSDSGERVTGNGIDQRAASPEQRVAAVALAMQKADFYWPTATANSSGNRLQFCIGIHSGPVTAGVICTERLQYDIWGDTVNVASRMESTSEPGRIHVSEVFATALKEALTEPLANAPLFRLAERGEIEVKGKGTMQTYWLE